LKIAVACDGSDVSAHFGRCERYMFVSVDADVLGEIEWLENPGHEPGALPELMRQNNVDVVLAGGAGPRAQQLLESVDIKLISGVSGDALEAVKALIDGTLQTGDSECHHI